MSASNEQGGADGRIGRASAGESSERVLEALSGESGLTTAEVSSATGLARSTVGKTLVALEQAGKAYRDEGGRDGARRLPDRWKIVEEPAQTAVADTAAAPVSNAADPRVAADRLAEERSEQDDVSADSQVGADASVRLRPGQLDGLVLGHLTRHAGEGPLGPDAVAKALGRSSGAVGNCMVRLASDGRLRLVSEHPRRYEIVVSQTDASATRGSHRTRV